MIMPPETLAQMLQGNKGCTAPLPYRVIRAEGADAQEFLQGQLTLDLKRLPDDSHRPAAWCNAKGRVWALLQVWRDANGYCLLVPDNQAESFIKRMRMFVLRANVSLDPLALTVQGIIDAGPGSGLHTEQGKTLLWHDAHHALRIAEQAEPETLPVEHWLALRILAGDAQVDASLQEKFLPQALGLEQRDGLHFNKGCYVGQEVVARVHYKGRSPQQLACYLNPDKTSIENAQILRDICIGDQRLIQVVEYC